MLDRGLNHLQPHASWNEAEFNSKFKSFAEKVYQLFTEETDTSTESGVRWIYHVLCNDFCELKILSCDHPDELSMEKNRTLLLAQSMEIPEDFISMVYQILNDDYAASIVKKVPVKSPGSNTIMYYAGHLWDDLAYIFDFRRIDTMPDLVSDNYKSKIAEAHQKIEERYNAIMELYEIMKSQGFNLPLPVVNSAIRSCFRSKIQLHVFNYLVKDRNFVFYK